MRWIVLAGLAACGTEGDDTAAPAGLVEVFDVDCSNDPDGDGVITVPELEGGPPAIGVFEHCYGGDDTCHRLGTNEGIDGMPAIRGVDCWANNTRVYVIR